jgi:hypothetical protein
MPGAAFPGLFVWGAGRGEFLKRVKCTIRNGVFEHLISALQPYSDPAMFWFVK